jgi:hypothetical protein
MKTLEKNSNVKSSAKKEISKKEKSLDSKNIQALTEEIKEKKVNVYKFDYENLDSDSLKKKRQNARNKLNSFVRDIINFSDLQKDNDKLKEQIKSFNTFYKEIYVSNDYSIKSLRNKIEGKEKQDLERMLEIIKKENKK